jgi:hypothetical protein
MTDKPDGARCEQLSVVFVARGYAKFAEDGAVWVTRGIYRLHEDPLPEEMTANAVLACGPCAGAEAVAFADRLAALLRWLGYQVHEETVADD